jgi:alditol oxidase
MPLPDCRLKILSCNRRSISGKMKRKKFIRLSSGLLLVPFLSPLRNWSFQDRLKNWAGNLEYSTDRVFYPDTVEKIQDLVKSCHNLRALGTRHCFNNIADSRDNLISTRSFNRVLELDPEAHTVTVEGGIKYGELAPYLHEKGFALHNLASLPHISVAGSCSTATHGSGVGNGNLSTAVRALEMVVADGSLVRLTRDLDGENFVASVVGLGSMGILTRITLDIQPAYMMRQNVFTGLPMDQLKDHFDEIVSAGYSVSLFTDWQTNRLNEVWIKSRIGTDKNYQGIPDFYGATAATRNLHPIMDLSPENCTDQMGVPGPWYERLPHFKMGFTPSSGKELQSEYFIPRRHAVDAILAVSRLGKEIGPHLFISEIRTIAADKLWMSPCRHQDSVTIHFTWKQNWAEVQKLLTIIERELAPFNARPHWGKLFMVSPSELAARYEKLGDFKSRIRLYDPEGKFRNQFISHLIYGLPVS